MVFIHIAKCGGVSVDTALKMNFLFHSKRLTSYESLQAAKKVYHISDPLKDDYHSVLQYRDHILRYFLENVNYQFVSGHFCFNEDLYYQYNQKFNFVTMLRNPVHRFLSSYFYNYSKDNDSPWKIRCTLDEYVDTSYGKNLGHDYVKFIGGLRKNNDYTSNEAINRALSLLRLFSVIGILENPEHFQNAIHKKLGLNIKLKRKNISPVSKDLRKQQTNQSAIDKIEKICTPDLIIYNEALRLNNLVSS